MIGCYNGSESVTNCFFDSALRGRVLVFSMDLFLGLDGGGTTTRAVLVDHDGFVVGEGTGGPANYHNVGVETAAQTLRAATDAAWQAAGLSPRPADWCFAGLAAIKGSVDMTRMTLAAEAVGLAPVGRVMVANDLQNALAGGLDGRPGIALIAGTGSNCLGRDATGRTFMSGGWDWLLDEGGGVSLAIAGLRAATRAADGRAEATALLPAALAFFGLTEADELSARLYSPLMPPEEIAGFAEVVTRLAGEDDPAALAVLAEGSNGLARMVASVARELDFAAAPEVVILGGCARSGPPYQPMVERAILDAVPEAQLREPVYQPKFGAAINALRLAMETPPSLKFHP
jgi:N-acetylglucosamine kinase-like BadF-type ATPase